MNETLDCIPGRRSIRVYREQAVNEPDLELLLRAAMATPNACNSQPWEFIYSSTTSHINAKQNSKYS